MSEIKVAVDETIKTCIKIIRIKSVSMCGVNIVCADDLISAFKRLTLA